MTSTVDVTGPFDARWLLSFFGRRALAGVEEVTDDSYARTLRLPHGPAVTKLVVRPPAVEVTLWLSDPSDLAAGLERARWLFDLDSDLGVIESHLAGDPALRGSVRGHPGLRVPGHVDGFEVAIRAIVGQQISVAGARTVLERLVRTWGEPCPVVGGPSLSRLFPTPQRLSVAEPELLPMPKARARALIGLAAAVSDGAPVLDRGVDLVSTRRALLARPGIGPWTADYIAMRALGNPDVFLATDLGVRHGLDRLGLSGADPGVTDRWRPWRSYALMHVWKALDDEAT